jgi:hypothetical protein
LKDEITAQQYLLKFEDGQLATIRRASNISSYGVIKGIMGSRVVDTLPLRIRCECIMQTCEEIVEVNLGERRDLRRNYPRGFITVTAHNSSSHEDTLLATDLYCVVQMPQFPEVITDL